jgi:tetratricopeptide (TPR) repeat protein
MTRPKIVNLLIAFLFAIGPDASPVMAATSDDPPRVDSSLTFLAHVETIYVNVDNEPLTAWVKPIFAVLDTRFAAATKPQTIVVEVTLHPDRRAEVIVAARPGLSDADRQAVVTSADPATSPHTRVVDGTFRIVAKINGGTPEDLGPLTPPLPKLGDRKFAEFRPANTARKLVMLKTWARVEALPLLAEFARHRDKQNDGATRALGNALAAIKRDGPIGVAALTEKNPNFWRALVEAPRGDSLVPAVWVALCVANGQIGFAGKIANAVAPFHTDDFGSSEVLRGFRWRSQVFDEDVEERIRKGITLNDQGHFDAALKIYSAVLNDDPNSAWALYERFQTILTRGLKAHEPENKAMEAWPATRTAMLQADPMYASMASAEGPDELYDLLLRKEAETLFKDRDQFGRDVARYADIALDIGQPGFAALNYWNAYRSLEPQSYGNRNLIEDFLYSLERLDIKDIKKNFRGDHATEFKRIDDQRAKRKREMLKDK